MKTDIKEFINDALGDDVDWIKVSYIGKGRDRNTGAELRMNREQFVFIDQTPRYRIVYEADLDDDHFYENGNEMKASMFRDLYTKCHKLMDRLKKGQASLELEWRAS